MFYLLFLRKYAFFVFRMRKTTLNLDIGKVIKERRALLGISQQDLSDYSGVGISTVKDLERGVGNPSIETLKKILDVVGLEIILQVNLPKSHKVYHSKQIFPVFTNMLPEGANRRALCRLKKFYRKDFFGLLELIY